MNGNRANMRVNGVVHSVSADSDTPLLYVLRNEIGLNGPRFGCGLGQCGSCMVLIDGKATHSCNLPVSRAFGHAITTLEGLSTEGTLHPVQQAFIEEQAAQCGYCSNGMIVRTVSLLTENQSPTDEEIRIALDDNLCRCGSHIRILRAVKRAALLSARKER